MKRVVLFFAGVAAGIALVLMAAGGTGWPVKFPVTTQETASEAPSKAEAKHEATGRVELSEDQIREAGITLAQAGGGRIVNIASIAGKEGNPNAAHYSSSKAGLIALTKSLGKELAQHDILVNAVTPAAAKTAIFDQMTQAHIDFMLSKIPKARFVQVEELAAMVAWLASEDCAFSTGAVFDISGGRATY